MSSHVYDCSALIVRRSLGSRLEVLSIRRVIRVRCCLACLLSARLSMKIDKSCIAKAIDMTISNGISLNKFDIILESLDSSEYELKIIIKLKSA